jgi:Tol biopolymer transport system component
MALEAWSRANNAVAYGFGTIFTVSEVDLTPQAVLLETRLLFTILWSPDGTQLVVIETEQSGASEWLVERSDSNTRRLMQLSTNAEDETIILPVVWSPDGDWISYALSQQVDEQNWGANILLLDTACIDDPEQACEPHELEITDDSGERPSLELEGGGTMPEHWWGAVWSPDGEQLAFVCGQHLCFLNADGTNFRRLDFELRA